MPVLARSQDRPIDETLDPGSLVGAYRVETLLACGGMGAVYRASHTILPRRAALKILHASMARFPRACDGLLQEARILESLARGAGVQIFDAGRLPDGRPWVAMELLAGETAADALQRRKKLSIFEAVRVALGVLDALELAHAAGVVHRDVKPENIMLTEGGVKLIDWGVAWVIGAASESSTAGTPSYMAPEQLRGAALDGRADLYALGVVLYELLAGEAPFRGDRFADVALRQLHAPPPDLRARRADAPPELARLIAALLEKDPAERPSLDETRAQLAALDEADPDLSIEIEIDLEDDDEEEEYSDYAVELPRAPRPNVRVPHGPCTTISGEISCR